MSPDEFVPGVLTVRSKLPDDEVLRAYGLAEMQRTLDELTAAMLEVYFERNPVLSLAVRRA